MENRRVQILQGKRIIMEGLKENNNLFRIIQKSMTLENNSNNNSKNNNNNNSKNNSNNKNTNNIYWGKQLYSEKQQLYNNREQLRSGREQLRSGGEQLRSVKSNDYQIRKRCDGHVIRTESPGRISGRDRIVTRNTEAMFEGKC